MLPVNIKVNLINVPNQNSWLNEKNSKSLRLLDFLFQRNVLIISY